MSRRKTEQPSISLQMTVNKTVSVLFFYLNKWCQNVYSAL